VVNVCPEHIFAKTYRLGATAKKVFLTGFSPK